MAFIPATNVLQVELRGTYFGEEVENVMYFTPGTAITSGAVEDLFDYLEGTILPDVLYGRSESWIVDELYGTDLTSSSAPTYTRVLSPAQQGTAPGAPLPGSCAAVISYRTAGRGRASRGRSYIPGLLESDVTDNLVDAGVFTVLVGALEQLLAGAGIPTPWVWVVLSRYLNGSPRASGLAQPILDVLSTSLLVSSQRKRVK